MQAFTLYIYIYLYSRGIFQVKNASTVTSSFLLYENSFFHFLSPCVQHGARNSLEEWETKKKEDITSSGIISLDHFYCCLEIH
jgi:hypothetical protein